MNPPHRHVRNLSLILASFITARTAFILLMPTTFSRDVHAWLHVMQILDEGKNPYVATGVLNWPPFWMQMIYFIHKLSDAISVSPERVIQAILIAGEAMLLILCYDIIVRFFKKAAPVGLLIVAFALNPICFLLSCQHGNFDIFVGFWILAFVWMMLAYLQTKRQEQWLMACFFLGIGIFTKTVPAILVPFLAISIRHVRPIYLAFGGMLLFTPVVIGMGTIYVLAPKGVTEHVLQYRSMGGWYGISGILGRLELYPIVDIYLGVVPLLFLSAMLFAGWKCFRKTSMSADWLLSAVLLMLIAVPTFGPGYSPPYILWFLGLLIIQYAIAGKAFKKYLVIGYIILVLTYVTEYAFFPSHGSFGALIDKSPSMAEFCGWMGSMPRQVIIRIPMFLFYLGLVMFLVKKLQKKELAT